MDSSRTDAPKFDRGMTKFRKYLEQFIEVDKPLTTDERVILRDYFTSITSTAKVCGFLGVLVAAASVIKQRRHSRMLFNQSVSNLIAASESLSKSEIIHRAISLKKRNRIVLKSLFWGSVGLGAGYMAGNAGATYYNYQKLLDRVGENSNVIKVADLVGYRGNITPKLAAYYTRTVRNPDYIITDPSKFLANPRSWFAFSNHCRSGP